VVIYVGADGTVGPPLLVFPASRLAPISQLKTEKGRKARRAQMALWNKPERFTVHIPVFNVLDEDEVVLDGEFEEDAAPSSDIAAARRQQRKVETTRLKRLRKRMADLARFTVYKEVVAYRAKNETGWMVSPLMVAWLTDVFVPNTTSGTDGLRHLYMDNMGAHETPSVQIQMIDSGIRFHPLPPNCSHLLQPLDHSLNATVKYINRILHARWLLRPIEQGVLATVTRWDPASAQVMRAEKVKRKRQPKRKLVLEEVEEKKEEEEEEKEGEGEGTEGVKGESRTRDPRKEEVEERIVASVYALSMTNVLHSWEHTLKGTNLVAAAVAGHNQREKDGCQVTIPTTSKKKRKKSDDPLAQEQLEEMIRAQMEEEEQVMNSLGDELHVVGKWELAGIE
jgi:DDE superfamily endonuclease